MKDGDATTQYIYLIGILSIDQSFIWAVPENKIIMGSLDRSADAFKVIGK